MPLLYGELVDDRDLGRIRNGASTPHLLEVGRVYVLTVSQPSPNLLAESIMDLELLSRSSHISFARNVVHLVFPNLKVIC